MTFYEKFEAIVLFTFILLAAYGLKEVVHDIYDILYEILFARRKREQAEIDKVTKALEVMDEESNMKKWSGWFGMSSTINQRFINHSGKSSISTGSSFTFVSQPTCEPPAEEDDEE